MLRRKSSAPSLKFDATLTNVCSQHIVALQIAHCRLAFLGLIPALKCFGGGKRCNVCWWTEFNCIKRNRFTTLCCLSVDCIEYTILQVFWCPFVGAGLGQDWKRTCAQNISESRTNWFSWFFGILCFTDCVFGNCIDRSMAINNLISIVCWMS